MLGQRPVDKSAGFLLVRAALDDTNGTDLVARAFRRESDDEVLEALLVELQRVMRQHDCCPDLSHSHGASRDTAGGGVNDILLMQLTQEVKRFVLAEQLHKRR
ncbi:hypothetical protein D3C73_1343510 [compost metagenome]